KPSPSRCTSPRLLGARATLADEGRWRYPLLSNGNNRGEPDGARSGRAVEVDRAGSVAAGDDPVPRARHAGALLGARDRVGPRDLPPGDRLQDLLVRGGLDVEGKCLPGRCSGLSGPIAPGAGRLVGGDLSRLLVSLSGRNGHDLLRGRGVDDLPGRPERVRVVAGLTDEHARPPLDADALVATRDRHAVDILQLSVDRGLGLLGD